MAPLLFFLFLLCKAASETVVVQVKPEQLGQDVTLPCDAGDVTIRAAEWTRSDPKPAKGILFYAGGFLDDKIQQADLVTKDLKTGNVSLILKNVSREDVGTYECRVATAGSRRKKRANSDFKLIKTVRLRMKDPENQNGDNNNNNNNGDIMDIFTRHRGGSAAAAGVFLLVCLVSAAVGLFLVSKFKRQREKKPEPSADEETGDNLL
ncbi:uncharacterized protein LOC115590067 [Sparus aurata]|uniref:uncharacterized protein LOC115590067 n=1 Tax=Sparus aurata TaxID=8175 RepID=UPI0011C0D26A|nr:uncharacterized protein LOC115590067 [Sparus aurata]